MQHALLKKTASLVPIAVFVAMATLAVPAAADDDPWKVRFAVVSMDPTGDQFYVPDDEEMISYQSSNGVGFAIDFEYRASRRLGIDFGVISSSPGFTVAVDAQPLSVSASADVRVTPIYAALNIHLTPDSRFDLYIGPLLAYVFYEGFELSAGPGLTENFTSSNGFGIGAVLGLDIGLGDGPWFINGAIRYLDTTFEASPSDDDGVGKTDLNPMIYSLGVGLRF